MSDSLVHSRRQALKLVAGVPMLPVAASLAGWSGLAEAASATGSTFTFNGMAAPSLANAAQMATTFVASTMTRTGVSGQQVTFELGHENFFLTGATVPHTLGGTVLAGGYFNAAGQPILDTTDANQRQFFSDCPDGMSLLTIPGGRSKKGDANRVFAVVQFEYTTRNVAGASMYGLLPSQIAVLTLDQDAKTGRLSLVSYYPVDTAPANGLWITCGASLSPWNTHLSSEEYEPDATVATNTQLRTFSQNFFGNADTARPYHYGHLPEVTVNADGTGSIKKHYCLGRISHELVHVCPDQIGRAHV